MILPFWVAVPTSNAPQGVFSSTQNLILANLGSTNALAAYNLQPPLIPGGSTFLPFKMTNVDLVADTACTVSFGLYNGTTFYEYFRRPLLANVGWKSSEWRENLYFPVSGAPQYLPCWRLGAAPGSTVNLYGWLEIIQSINALNKPIT